MESRSKKSGRTPKKSSAKAKGKKKAIEKDTEKISLLQSCINDPQTSILAPNIEDNNELKLRFNLFNKLIDHHYSNDKDNNEINAEYPILDQQDNITEIEMPMEMGFNEGLIPEKCKKFLAISDKKYYLNDHPVNKYQSINNLLRYFILHHLNKLNFSTVHDQALDILTDVTKAYIERIGFLANSFSSVPGSVSNSVDIIKKTFLEIYPNGIDEIKEYMDSLKQSNKMEIEKNITDIQSTPSAKGLKDEPDEESMHLLKRELFLMKSPFVKKKKQSFSALYKDAFRMNSQNMSVQGRVNPMNRSMTPGMKTYENTYRYSTPQPTDRRKKGSDFEYDDEDLSSSSRLRRTRSRVNYSEEYDDEDYGDDLDDEGPKKKKRKSNKRKDV